MSDKPGNRDLKQRFYEHLQSFGGEQQIFIVGNMESPTEFQAMATVRT